MKTFLWPILVTLSMAEDAHDVVVVVVVVVVVDVVVFRQITIAARSGFES